MHSLPSSRLLSLSLPDLSRITSLDSRDRTSTAAGVAGDEVQAVLALAEFGVW